MDTEDNGVMTVANFRRKGFRVDVQHLRRIKTGRGRLVQKHEVNDFDRVNPKGGRTIVKIVSPSGEEAEGQANVFSGDTYCKRTGISIALSKAFAKLNLKATA